MMVHSVNFNSRLQKICWLNMRFDEHLRSTKSVAIRVQRM
jgi:hypothetical protein